MSSIRQSAAWLFCLGVIAVGVVAVARAQTAAIDGVIVGPAGLCLDVSGSWSNTSPPPAGTPAILSTCDGSADQGWSYLIGDSDGDLHGLAFTSLVARGNQVVTADEYQGHALFRGTGPIVLRSIGPGGPVCLTAHAAPVTGQRVFPAPCDGRAEQSFRMHR